MRMSCHAYGNQTRIIKTSCIYRGTAMPPPRLFWDVLDSRKAGEQCTQHTHMAPGRDWRLRLRDMPAALCRLCEPALRDCIDDSDFIDEPRGRPGLGPD